MRPPWRSTMRLHDGQPDAGAGESRSVCRRWNMPNSAAGVAHVEAGAVVLDEDLHRAVSGAAADLDQRPLAPGRILEGIADQVLQHLAQQDRVALDHRQRRHLETGRRVGLAQLSCHVARQVVEVDGPRRQRDPGGARVVEQVVDQLAHAVAAMLDALEHVAGLLAQALVLVLVEQAGEAVDGAQRRAQVVGDRVGEALQLAVGLGPVRRACARRLDCSQRLKIVERALRMEPDRLAVLAPEAPLFLACRWTGRHRFPCRVRGTRLHRGR
jgi:hypothetical protein